MKRMFRHGLFGALLLLPTTLSAQIRVNQVGMYPHQEKTAVIPDSAPDATDENGPIAPEEQKADDPKPVNPATSDAAVIAATAAMAIALAGVITARRIKVK